MIPRFLCALVLVALAIGLCPARADDVDAVKEKLFQAKKAYDAEAQKFRTAIGDLLDKREDDARRAGDKKLVDQVKAEREKFEKEGEMPAAVPPAPLTQIRAARSELDKAYTAAIKDYLRLKEDAAAEATEKEQQKIALEASLQFGKRTYLSSIKPFNVQVQHSPFTNNGTVKVGKDEVKLKVDGNFVPHSLHTHPPEKGTAQVRYTLSGNWTSFRVNVGVPTVGEGRDPDSPLTFEVLGDGKSLWKSEPIAKRDTFQLCAIRIEKVKVLTLQVHCKDGYGWARAVWVEPILTE